MANESFRLSSKLSDITNLLDSGDEHNVLIEVGQTPNHREFKAHSIILKSRCSYFHDKLTKINEDENNIKNIKIPNISPPIFKIIIEYIYGGVIIFDEISASTILDLLIAANELGLEDFVEYLQSILTKNHTAWMRKNLIKILKISLTTNHFKSLRKFCDDVIAKQPNLIFESEEFKTLPEDILLHLLKLDNLQIEEGKIWDQVIKWGIAQNPTLDSNPAQWSDENFSTLKNSLRNCLPCIRYFQISGEDVLEKVQPYEKVLDHDLWKDIMAKFMTPDKPINSVVLPPRTGEHPTKKDTNLVRRITSVFTKNKPDKGLGDSDEKKDDESSNSVAENIGEKKRFDRSSQKKRQALQSDDKQESEETSQANDEYEMIEAEVKREYPNAIKYGRLHKESILKRYVERYFVFHDGTLYYFKDYKDVSSKKQIKIEKSFKVTNSKINDPNKYKFEIVTPTKIYKFYASTEEDQADWIKVIQEYIEQLPEVSSSDIKEKTLPEVTNTEGSNIKVEVETAASTSEPSLVTESTEK